jgi:hypothetical protein
LRQRGSAERKRNQRCDDQGVPELRVHYLIVNTQSRNGMGPLMRSRTVRQRKVGAPA